MTMNNAGILIKQKRKEKKLTLQDVADKLEVSKATVSKWENNQIKNLKRMTQGELLGNPVVGWD